MYIVDGWRGIVHSAQVPFSLRRRPQAIIQSSVKSQEEKTWLVGSLSSINSIRIALFNQVSILNRGTSDILLTSLHSKQRHGKLSL